MPIENHIPKLPNLLAFGPESASGEREKAINKEQKSTAEIKVIITILFFFDIVFFIPFKIYRIIDSLYFNYTRIV